MGAIPKLAIVASNDGEIDGVLPALIPPGVYQLGLQYWTTYRMYGRAPKLALCFHVLDHGPHFGTMVARHYNVKRHIGKLGRGGRFAAPPTGDLFREYVRLFAAPYRFDRFDLQQLKSHVILGRVDTVTQTARQQELAEGARYSIVRELLRIEQ